MPFCPKCKDEYRPGFTVCADCGVQLVDKLEEKAEVSEPPADNAPSFDPLDIPRDSEADFKLVLLRNVSNPMESEIIKGLLEQSGIPCHIDYPNLSQYTKLYFNMTLEGVNIYVRKQDYEQAALLIEGEFKMEEIPEED